MEATHFYSVEEWCAYLGKDGEVGVVIEDDSDFIRLTLLLERLRGNKPLQNDTPHILA